MGEQTWEGEVAHVLPKVAPTPANLSICNKSESHGKDPGGLKECRDRFLSVGAQDRNQDPQIRVQELSVGPA